MGESKSVIMRFRPDFYANVKRAAELRGVGFSEFMRVAAAELARKEYERCGLEVPDLGGWHMPTGGDFSEARARKDKNYRKRSVNSSNA